MKTLVGLHIPKCAGNSILESFNGCLSKNQIYQSTSLIQNFNTNRKEFFEFSSYSNLKLVYGHHIIDEMLKCVPKPIFLFTIIREPVERLISHFYYINRLRLKQGKAPFSISDYLKISKSMTQFINLRFSQFSNNKSSDYMKTIEILSCFDFVATIDEIDKLILKINNDFGYNLKVLKKNVSPIDYKQDPNYNILKENIEKMIPNDILLYNEFIRRKSESNANNDNPFFDIKKFKWRKNKFMKEPINIDYIIEKQITHIYWELKEYKKLNDYFSIFERSSKAFNLIKQMHEKNISSDDK
ncbi:MAG: sulfotransferase family 2 domain-containing protein [Bacteroidales bacterium]